VRPSGEISGGATELTCGWRSIVATVWDTAAALPPPRSVPSSTANTRVAESPAWAGKRASSRSIAAWESVPGVRRSSLNPPPAAAVRAPRATSSPIEMASDRFQCVEAARAIRERREDMAR
jgi:hypothetical protein